MILATDAIYVGSFLRSKRLVVRCRTVAGCRFPPACMPLQPQRWRHFGLVASAGRVPHLRRPKPPVRAEDPVDLQLPSPAEGGRNGAVGTAPDGALGGPIPETGELVADTGGVDAPDTLQSLQQPPEHSPAGTSGTAPSSPGAQLSSPILPCRRETLLAGAAASCFMSVVRVCCLNCQFLFLSNSNCCFKRSPCMVSCLHDSLMTACWWVPSTSFDTAFCSPSIEHRIASHLVRRFSSLPQAPRRTKICLLLRTLRCRAVLRGRQGRPRELGRPSGCGASWRRRRCARRRTNRTSGWRKTAGDSRSCGRVPQKRTHPSSSTAGRCRRTRRAPQPPALVKLLLPDVVAWDGSLSALFSGEPDFSSQGR